MPPEAVGISASPHPPIPASPQWRHVIRPVPLREGPMFLKTVPVILFVGAAAFVTSSTVHDTRAAKIPVVTVHAKEFAFDAPKTIAAGQTSFRLVNDGKMLHHLQIMKLENGKTFADLQAAMKNPGPPPTWLVSVGGPNAAVPGNTIEATLTLDAGNYVIACFVPSPGDPTPH